MKRNIIEVDRNKCTGCGLCLLCCEEGALEMVDGKAALVHENVCDALGSCIAVCPANAITDVVKECEPCDIPAIMAKLIPQGKDAVATYLRHLEHHNYFHLLDAAHASLRCCGMPIPEHITK